MLISIYDCSWSVRLSLMAAFSSVASSPSGCEAARPVTRRTGPFFGAAMVVRSVQRCAVVERGVFQCLPESIDVHSLEVASRLGVG
jgi:hypothetical protein